MALGRKQGKKKTNKQSKWFVKHIFFNYIPKIAVLTLP